MTEQGERSARPGQRGRYVVRTVRHALTFVTCVLVGSCGNFEQPHRYYDSCADAIAAGELERGWLPNTIPTTARHIHIQSDIDTNSVWLRFELPTMETHGLQSRLDPIPRGDLPQFHVPRPRAASDWWFEDLIWAAPANDNALNAQVFVSNAPDETCNFAFDQASGSVYVWCASEQPAI